MVGLLLFVLLFVPADYCPWSLWFIILLAAVIDEKAT